jgi:hypothetical protein
VPRDQLYNSTMYVLCPMLVVGLICNVLVRPVNSKWYMSAEDVAALQAPRRGRGGRRWLLWHRKGRLQLRRPGVLGVRRHPAGLGRVDHPHKRDEDLLTA